MIFFKQLLAMNELTSIVQKISECESQWTGFSNIPENLFVLNLKDNDLTTLPKNINESISLTKDEKENQIQTKKEIDLNEIPEDIDKCPF